MDLLLGIDMGTGSTKGVLVDAAGTVIASETVAHSMNLPRPGWAEVDAEGLWWREVCEVAARLTAQMPTGGVLAATGVVLLLTGAKNEQGRSPARTLALRLQPGAVALKGSF